MIGLSNPIVLRSGGFSLFLLIAAAFMFLLAAFGVGTKLGFNLVDLGLASFVLSFIL